MVTSLVEREFCQYCRSDAKCNCLFLMSSILWKKFWEEIQRITKWKRIQNGPYYQLHYDQNLLTTYPPTKYCKDPKCKYCKKHW